MKRIVTALLLTASLTLAASVPPHLADFSEEYQTNPRQAAIGTECNRFFAHFT
ncbi:MAG: hypothetical protein GY953_20080, partial [bacterium]|nr:hypothetical protein [bacterium]